MDDQTKAAVIVDLLTGEPWEAVAKKYGLPRRSRKRWEREVRSFFPADFDPLGEALRIIQNDDPMEAKTPHARR